MPVTDTGSGLPVADAAAAMLGFNFANELFVVLLALAEPSGFHRMCCPATCMARSTTRVTRPRIKITANVRSAIARAPTGMGAGAFASS